MPGDGRASRRANTAQSETVTTGRSAARRDQNRRRMPGRPPEGWFPIDKGTPLQVLLKQRMTAVGAALSEDGDGPPLSTHEVAARSGQGLSANTVSLILRGKTVRPSDQTIEGLAVALEIDAKKIRDAIHATERGATIQLPKRAAKLSPEGWGQLLTMLDYLLAQEGK